MTAKLRLVTERYAKRCQQWKGLVRQGLSSSAEAGNGEHWQARTVAKFYA